MDSGTENQGCAGCKAVSRAQVAARFPDRVGRRPLCEPQGDGEVPDPGVGTAGRGKLGHGPGRQNSARRSDWKILVPSMLEQTVDLISLSNGERSLHRRPDAEGKLVAYSQVCTHLSCAVVYDKASRNCLPVP